MMAFILAAGKGERMRPLTDHVPKPLLCVRGKPMIVHLLEKLRAAGITECVINIAYLGEQICQALGCGDQFGIKIRYSAESEPLETGGAILHAQDLLGKGVFLLVNADVWSDFDFAALLGKARQTRAVSRGGAHLVFVGNPAHNSSGDYILEGHHVSSMNTARTFDGSAPLQGRTFAGISLMSPELVYSYPQARPKFPLREVFDWGISQNKVSGELHMGEWVDVGTPERLALIREGRCE